MGIFFNKSLWKYIDKLLLEMKTPGTRIKGFLKVQLIAVFITVVELLYVSYFSNHDMIGYPSLSFLLILSTRHLYLRFKNYALSKMPDRYKKYSRYMPRIFGSVFLKSLIDPMTTFNIIAGSASVVALVEAYNMRNNEIGYPKSQSTFYHWVRSIVPVNRRVSEQHVKLIIKNSEDSEEVPRILGTVFLPEYRNPVGHLTMEELEQEQKKRAIELLCDMVGEAGVTTLGIDPIHLTKEELLGLYDSVQAMYSNELTKSDQDV